MSFKSRQRGFSIASITFIILLASFFGTLLVKLGPIYSDHYYLNAIVKDISLQPNMADRSIAEIRESLRKNLDVNNVKFNIKEGITMKRANDSQATLILDYEKRVSVFFNVDAVVVFYEEYPSQP